MVQEYATTSIYVYWDPITVDATGVDLPPNITVAYSIKVQDTEDPKSEKSIVNEIQETQWVVKHQTPGVWRIGVRPVFIDKDLKKIWGSITWSDDLSSDDQFVMRTYFVPGMVNGLRTNP